MTQMAKALMLADKIFFDYTLLFLNINISRWKQLDEEKRKPFIEEAERLRQLHQQVKNNRKAHVH